MAGLKVNKKGYCFLCLQRPQKGKDDLDGKFHSFMPISSYLDLNGFLTNSFWLCGGCSARFDEVSILFNQLEGIKYRIDKSLATVHDRMRLGSEGEDVEKFFAKNNCKQSPLNTEECVKLRKELMDTCCRKAEKVRQDEELKPPKAPGVGTFGCHLCNKRSISQADYDLHMKFFHPSIGVIVPPVIKRKKLNPGPSFFCSKCEKTYKTKNGFRNHLEKCQIKIQGGMLSCDLCTAKCSSVECWKKHMDTFHFQFECKKCTDKFWKRKDFLRHRKKVHLEEIEEDCEPITGELKEEMKVEGETIETGNLEDNEVKKEPEDFGDGDNFDEMEDEQEYKFVLPD